MRNWIIGAAAILAVAVPGVAAAQTGYVGAQYGNADAGAGADEDFYGLEGAVAFAGSGSIVFEVDAAVVDGDDSDTAFGLTGHVYARNDSHLFGGFIGVADSDAADTTWYGGLEANKYFTNWTLAGAVFYGNNDDNDVDGYGVNVEARAFIHDNFRVNGNIGYANVDAGAGDDDVMLYGVGGEYQFAAMPISITAGYNVADFDGGDIDTWTIGVRYNWGGTLRDRDRSGASQGSVTGVGSLF
ncbi:MAG: porin [Hyphomonadaceae bacterium]|nr:porin [Hyphomonadaceae bacterium]